MKASDEVMHQQLHHIVSSGRRAIGGANTMVIITSFYDEEKKATANLTAHDTSGDIEDAQIFSEVIDTIARSLNNLLKSNSDLQVIIRDPETGKDYDVDNGTFNRYVMEMKS